MKKCCKLIKKILFFCLLFILIAIPESLSVPLLNLYSKSLAQQKELTPAFIISICTLILVSFREYVYFKKLDIVRNDSEKIFDVTTSFIANSLLVFVNLFFSSHIIVVGVLNTTSNTLSLFTLFVCFTLIICIVMTFIAKAGKYRQLIAKHKDERIKRQNHLKESRLRKRRL